jgi:hypothetical protein
MNMYEIAISLTEKLQGVHPDIGVQIGDFSKKETWRLHFLDDHSEEHRQHAHQIVADHPVLNRAEQ